MKHIKIFEEFINEFKLNVPFNRLDWIYDETNKIFCQVHYIEGGDLYCTNVNGDSSIFYKWRYDSATPYKEKLRLATKQELKELGITDPKKEIKAR